MRTDDLRRLSMEGFNALDSTIFMFRTLSKFNLFSYGATRYTKYFWKYVIDHGDLTRVLKDEEHA